MSAKEREMVARAVRGEADKAREKYGSFASTHEAYGVLAEEVMELLQSIHANKRYGVQREAIQVAAVALRLAQQLEVGDLAFLERSGMR